MQHLKIIVDQLKIMVLSSDNSQICGLLTIPYLKSYGIHARQISRVDPPVGSTQNIPAFSPPLKPSQPFKVQTKVNCGFLTSFLLCLCHIGPKLHKQRAQKSVFRLPPFFNYSHHINFLSIFRPCSHYFTLFSNKMLT